MRGTMVVGAVLAGLLLAGCTGQRKAQDDAWNSLVAEDYASARAQYESILAGDPNNPYANLNLGVAYQGLGDNEMAVKHYQIAAANGVDAPINEVAQDGNTAARETTVATVAAENLRRLGS